MHEVMEKLLRQYWNLKSTETQEYLPYNIDQLEKLNEIYEKLQKRKWTIRFLRT